MTNSRSITPALSVFFPCFNEEANLEKTVRRATQVLEKITQRWEIIIVDDGSSDKTGEIARELRKEDDRIRVISHQINKGYGEALKTGFRNAKYPWVAFTDSDGQFNFEEIKNFLPLTGTADLILGYRIKRADSLLRILYGFVWKQVARILLGLTVRDYSCGFKLIKKEVFGAIQPLEAGEKVTQIEFLVKAKRLGFQFAEIGVHHFPRKFGQPTGANLLVTLKSIVDLFKLWWRFINKIEFLALLGILFAAAFLRLYKIDQYMTFLGDEGRDAIVVRRLIVNFDPILVGPGTSIGNMYLGPLYYYMMAPALFLSGLSPVGPVVQVAVLGIATVGFLWWISREWFGKAAAVVAASLYAVSPVIITYSRSSWNPNIMPFFALLSIYAIWRVWKHHEWKWLIVLGISYAFVLQSHYLGLLLAPTIGLFWLLALLATRNTRHVTRKFLGYTVGGLASFLLLMSPLVIFDARHGWRNFQAILTFFSQRQETVSFRPWNAIPDIWPIWQEMFVTRFMGGMNEIVGVILAVILLMGVVVLILKFSSLHSDERKSLALLITWIFVGLLGLGLYKQNIYDHYFGFMFAAPFILLGILAQQITNHKSQITNSLLFGGIVLLILLNLSVTSIRYPPQRQLQRTEEVARKITQEAEGKSFNLAVIAERNYEDAYQYFLEWWKYPVRDIDPLRYQETVADQLFVVCELPAEKCDPTHNPKAEVANFGWSKVDKEWDITGIRVYKLVHTQ